jgi:hypothetical protein
MKKNKKEDFYLTREQAIKLNELNLNFRNASSYFINFSLWDEDNWQFIEDANDDPRSNNPENEFEYWDVIKTLSNSEILELLPDHINYPKGEYRLTLRAYEAGYCVDYVKYSDLEEKLPGNNPTPLLRDALFELLIWLLKNRLYDDIIISSSLC